MTGHTGQQLIEAEEAKRRALAIADERSKENAALRAALAKIAAEQSFMNAQLAADTFQNIAREALK
jgi:hypothetical protein